MKLATHLDSLRASAETLQNQSFTHPKSFQNTLLRQVPITQVIRDAEPHESSLFTSTATKKTPAAAGTTTTGSESAASVVLRDREASLSALLSAVEQVVHQYPIDGADVLSRVDVMRVKAETSTASIQNLERIVDEQRRRLDDLSVGRNTSLSPPSYRPKQQQQQDGIVTEEMILLEEEEIKRLEQVIEQKSRR